MRLVRAAPWALSFLNLVSANPLATPNDKRASVAPSAAPTGPSISQPARLVRAPEWRPFRRAIVPDHEVPTAGHVESMDDDNFDETFDDEPTVGHGSIDTITEDPDYVVLPGEEDEEPSNVTIIENEDADDDDDTDVTTEEHHSTKTHHTTTAKHSKTSTVEHEEAAKTTSASKTSSATKTPTVTADPNTYSISGKLNGNVDAESQGDTPFPGNVSGTADFWVAPKIDPIPLNNVVDWAVLKLGDVFAAMGEAACKNQSIGTPFPKAAVTYNILDPVKSIWTVGLNETWEAYLVAPVSNQPIEKMENCKQIMDALVHCAPTAERCIIETSQGGLNYELGVRAPDGDDSRKLPGEQYLQKPLIVGRTGDQGHNQKYFRMAIVNPVFNGLSGELSSWLETKCFSGNKNSELSDNCWGQTPASGFMEAAELVSQNKHAAIPGSGYVSSLYWQKIEWLGGGCEKKIFDCIVRLAGMDPSQASWEDTTSNEDKDSGENDATEGIIKTITSVVSTVEKFLALA